MKKEYGRKRKGTEKGKRNGDGRSKGEKGEKGDKGDRKGEGKGEGKGDKGRIPSTAAIFLICSCFDMFWRVLACFAIGAALQPEIVGQVAKGNARHFVAW